MKLLRHFIFSGICLCYTLAIFTGGVVCGVLMSRAAHPAWKFLEAYYAH